LLHSTSKGTGTSGKASTQPAEKPGHPPHPGTHRRRKCYLPTSIGKTGFTKEGIIRNGEYGRGKYRDGLLFSIIRENCDLPRILTGVQMD